MAIQDGNTYYTAVIFVENGKPVVRRMHRLDLQARDGQLHSFEGERLPDSFTFYSGISHKDAHLGTVLGLPKEGVPKSLAGFLPGPRDWVYVIVGAAMPLILKGVLILVTTGF